MMFASRADAGRELGRRLKEQGLQFELALGLPRGGVVVAAEVARVLNLPLDVLIVRKLGHPFHREFAVGAIAEHGVTVLDEALLARNPFVRAELNEVIAEEQARLLDYQARFHRHGLPALRDKTVVLVDDGIATGATTEAAARAARSQGARGVIIAVPVASTQAVERLGRVADAVIALYVDPEFEAVGRYYQAFPQTTDEEVMGLLYPAQNGSGARA
jgi:putative phosphoribosyl transferase